MITDYAKAKAKQAELELANIMTIYDLLYCHAISGVLYTIEHGEITKIQFDSATL